MDAYQLRRFVYDQLIAHGFPPKLADIARHFSTDIAAARAAIANLRIGKTIVPDPTTGEIWMAGPFSAAPTSYKVTGSATWFANCAWDMLGIPLITREVVQVAARCTDCNAAISFTASPSAPPALEAIVHFLVPARHWYDDLGFT